MAKSIREQVIEKLNAGGSNLPADATEEEILEEIDRIKAEEADAENYMRLFGR